MPERRPSFGERIGGTFQRVLRSWPFLIAANIATVLWVWHNGPPPGGWLHAVSDDPFPYTGWINVLTFITFEDVVVVGIYQLIQSRRQDQMMSAQTETLRALYRQGEAILHILERLNKD